MKFLIRLFNKDDRKGLNKSARPWKWGVHSDGRPYLDTSDKATAQAIKEQSEAFEGIKVS